MSDQRIWGPVLRQGIPLAIGMAAHAMFNLVDLVLVGRLGQAAIAGAHVATVVNFLPMVLGNGLSVATLARLSFLVGAGRMAEAGALSSRSQLWMLLFGLLLGVLGALTAVPCVDLQGVSGEARAIGIHYLVVSQLGCITMFALMQTTTTMRAVGESAVPLCLLIGTNVLNFVLALGLVFGCTPLGLPAFGAPGAAYATVVARGLGALIGYAWIARASHPLRLELRSLGGSAREVLGFFVVSLPQSAQMLVRTGLVILVTRIASDLVGESAVSALGVTTRLDTVVLFAAAGFASAATALTGNALGSGAQRRARRVGAAAALAAALFGAGIVGLFWWWARPILELFVAGAGVQVVQSGVEYLSVGLFVQPLAAWAIAWSGAIHGAERMVPPLVLDAVVYGLLLVPAVLVYEGGAATPTLVGVWWILAAANLLLAALYSLYGAFGRWIEHQAASCHLGSGGPSPS